MLLYNQTKKHLSWKMGEQFECAPWGHVSIPDELVDAVKGRGLPLDVTPVAPELRAQARVEDQQSADREAPLHALRKAADEAQASERSAKAEVERLQISLGEATAARAVAEKALAEKSDELSRAMSEKAAAEGLLAEAGSQATASEERALKAEALLAEAQKPQAKQDKQKRD